MIRTASTPSSESDGFPHHALVIAFEQLNGALLAFCRHLGDNPPPCWLPLTDAEKTTGVSPHTKLIELSGDIWYQHDGDGRRTESRHGLVALNDESYQLALAVNAAKQQFQHAVRPFRSEQATWRAALQTRGTALRDTLKQKGLARLHLKQCYRLLPLVDRRPEKAGFNWYRSGRSIKRLSAKQAMDKLLAMGSDKAHIALQIEKLQQLPAPTALAQIQTQAPLMRCNLRFANAPHRLAMNLSLPLFYLDSTQQPLPAHNEPPLQPPAARQRQLRSDCRIDSEPFLPSLRIHRYLT